MARPGTNGSAYGGAIFNQGGNVDISGTTFSYNIARAGNSQGGFGGGGGWGASGGGGGGVGRATNCGFCVPPPGNDPNAHEGANRPPTGGANGGPGGAPSDGGSHAIGGAVYSTVAFDVSGGTETGTTCAPTASTEGGGGTYGRGTPDGQWGHRLPRPALRDDRRHQVQPRLLPRSRRRTPRLTVSDDTVQEPDTGSENADFTVTLRPVQAAAVTVDYATHDATATAGQDYTARAGR